MINKRSYITEFIGLDLLRFFLSVAVVLRHYYYHFYSSISGEPPNASIGPELPFYNVLRFFYSSGQLAVQMFWLISGLIFYSIYYEEITHKKINFANFSFLRFTRLYPLHFLTLLIIAVVQLFFFLF